LSVVHIPAAPEIVPQPDWESLFSDVLEAGAAREHWRIITTELKDRALLSPGNGHALQRLVVAYVLYDRSLREVAERGVVTKPRRGNTKAIPRASLHFAALRELASDAAVLEGEFGLAPRRRSGATKAIGKQKVARASDEFLKARER
jgi:phage terminase small subunit